MPMQVSWIDADEVGALVGHLRVKTAVPPTVDEEPSFSPQSLLVALEPNEALAMFRAQVAAAATPVAPEPVEPVVHPDLQDFRSRLQAIRERAMGAGLLPGTVGKPETEEKEVEDAAEEADHVPEVVSTNSSWVPFKPSGHTVTERLENFAAWAQPQLGWNELFIIGDQGDLLWGQSIHQGLVQTTVMAWVSTSRMSAVFAFDRAPLLRRQMASGRQLTAVPCPTRLGLMHIAITSTQPLSDEHVPELRAALISAMEAGA
jgi:hypothetical protein